MKKCFGFMVLVCISVQSVLAAGTNCSILWYEQPAEVWSEALPIGSGRLGAMIYGGTANETIALNEDTVWSGEPHDYTNIGAKTHLENLRALIRAGKVDEAALFGRAHSLGVPPNQKAYQSLGRLQLSFPGHEDVREYCRQLDLSTALASVSYKVGDATYKREILASYPDQVIAMRFSCDQPGGLTFDASFTSFHEGYTLAPAGEQTLKVLGQADAIQFESWLKALNKGGSVSVDHQKLSVKGADSVVLLLVAATNYINYQDISADPSTRCAKFIKNIGSKSYRKIRRDHVKDHKKLYDRVCLDLGATEEDLKIPTDKLVQRAIDSTRSSLLEEQLFRFARYLQIAGARPGTQPLNLVGIWAEHLNAPWGGKWTLNINAQLNTWPVETTDLGECHEPLLALMGDLRVTGRKVAKEHYDCRGWVAHHNTDLWRGSAPVDTPYHGLWTLGSAWLCRHIWEHYDFSRDKDYLRRAYPTLKEAALFYEDFLTEDKDGNLSTCPAISFEQDYRLPSGKKGRLTYGPTMDNQIIRDLLTNCIMASEHLGVDEEQRATWKKIMGRLRPTQIDPDTGRVMEWAFKAEQWNISGQIAPLWGLSPGRNINPADTPELAAAAEKHLDYIWPRMPRHQDGGSWVTGTLLNAWVRLWNAEDAYKVIDRAIRQRLYPNLMMHFYTKKYFQIDGNMGTAAGITEMLMQSHRLNEKSEPIIDLLPALSVEWSTGSVEGLCARGAFKVDLTWEDGVLKSVKVRSLKGSVLNLNYKGKTVRLVTKAGKTYKLNGELR